jgi:hypothetical protein
VSVIRAELREMTRKAKPFVPNGEAAAMMSIDRALRDRRIFGAALGDDPATWRTWRVVLKASFGLELSRDEARVFAAVAGGRRPPTERVRELWAVIGRRGGKSRIAAALAVYFAVLVEYRLAPGERGMVLVLAASVEQARATLGYALAFLRASPLLAAEIADVTRGEIRLKSGIAIGIHTNSFRTTRGRSLCACIFDEVAYWRDISSAQPDSEVYSAVLPSLATTRGMLIGISSPYRKAGLLHAKYRSHFGVDSDDVLVVQGSSQTFNPLLTEAVIDAQRAADPTAAASEWDAEFRADLVGFLDDALIDAAVEHDRPLELAPRDGVHYAGYVDPSGGGSDAYAITVGHKNEDERFIADVVRGKRGDPRKITAEYAALCREYGIRSVVGDNYAKDWTQQAWREEGLRYEKAPQPASQLYLESLPFWTRGLISLPDHSALLRELRLLERIPGRVGKDQVVHPRGVHDDLANSVCGCVFLLMSQPAPDVYTARTLAQILAAPRRSGAGAVFGVGVGEREALIADRAFQRRMYGW